MKKEKEPQPLESPTCDDKVLWDVRMSSFYFPSLSVADELGLFPLLEKNPATAQEIAANLSLGARGTEALLGMLTSLGFLVQYQSKFSITELSRNYLLPQSPYYHRAALIAWRNSFPTHDSIRDALRNDSFHYLTDNWQAGGLSPEQAKQFTQRMHSIALPAATVMARGDHFMGVNRLLDVAGGSGCYSIALALRHPKMHFTILELPSVCPIAEQYAIDYGVQDQIDIHAIDMFKDHWPVGYDAVFFANIFHDWDREQCLQLARRSYEALLQGGRIYLHEMLLNDTKDGPLTTCGQSMNMLLVTQGKQFSASELDQILRECGFEDILVAPTFAYFSLISARKP